MHNIIISVSHFIAVQLIDVVRVVHVVALVKFANPTEGRLQIEDHMGAYDIIINIGLSRAGGRNRSAIVQQKCHCVCNRSDNKMTID